MTLARLEHNDNPKFNRRIEKFKAIARKAVLSERWMVWFEGLSIDETEDQSTCLAGEIPDYPALYGLLERIRDLNLHLVSV